jgi:hypothetical protein
MIGTWTTRSRTPPFGEAFLHMHCIAHVLGQACLTASEKHVDLMFTDIRVDGIPFRIHEGQAASSNSGFRHLLQMRLVSGKFCISR